MLYAIRSKHATSKSKNVLIEKKWYVIHNMFLICPMPTQHKICRIPVPCIGRVSCKRPRIRNGFNTTRSRSSVLFPKQIYSFTKTLKFYIYLLSTNHSFSRRLFEFQNGQLSICSETCVPTSTCVKSVAYHVHVHFSLPPRCQRNHSF